MCFRKEKSKGDDTVMVMTEDGLIDFVPEKDYKRRKKEERKAARKEYNSIRKHTTNDLTIIAIVNIIPAAYFCSYLKNGIVVVFLLLFLMLYVYWMDDWNRE